MIEMEFVSLAKICRCCLIKHSNFLPIFEIHNDYYLPKVIQVCTGLAIHQSDGLPEVVCETCLLKLITAYETRRLFLRSNGQLKEQQNRLKQSEQEIMTELNSTAAKCVEQAVVSSVAATVADSGSVLLNDESILESGPITTWDNEINMHIEQLQDGNSELVANIEDSLDELVIEKYENLEKGGYSFPLVEPTMESLEEAKSTIPQCSAVGVLMDSRISISKNEDTSEDEYKEEDGFPSYSDVTVTTEEEDGIDDCNNIKEEKIESQDCSICGKTFRNARLLKRHVHYHNASKTDCPICLRSFTHASNLKRHLGSHSPPKGGFSCSKCPGRFEEGFQFYSHLKIHKTSSDLASYIMRCERCGMETSSLAGFKYHMSEEHGIPKDQIKAFRCHICLTRFNSKQGMYRHIQYIHHKQTPPVQSSMKRFLCTECGKSFRRMRHLESHTNSHAGIRPFHCECGLSFAQKSGMNIHVRAKHQNQRNYVCKICRKSFAQSTHLKDHELIHTNRKEHECTVCKHRFYVKSNLMAHMRIHRRHPYCCRECGRQFMHSVRLEQHMATEH